MLFLDLADLILLESVVKFLDLTELNVCAFLELTDLASTLLIELYIQGFLPLAGLDIRYQIYRQRGPFLNGGKGTYYKTTVDMHTCTVRHAFVLEVEHLLPDPVAVLGL